MTNRALIWIGAVILVVSITSHSMRTLGYMESEFIRLSETLFSRALKKTKVVSDRRSDPSAKSCATREIDKPSTESVAQWPYCSAVAWGQNER